MRTFEVTLEDGDVVKINGACFMKLKTNLVKVEMKEGVPTIKGVTSEETRHPDGRVDVNIHVPTLVLDTKVNQPA